MTDINERTQRHSPAYAISNYTISHLCNIKRVKIKNERNNIFETCKISPCGNKNTMR
jgi:hypothetical protein